MCKKKTCLEVCVDSFASAMAAVRGGADRLELCSCLIVGGLTPDVALLEQIRRETELPIRCLMRPRFGDFLYTEEEIRLMETQIPRLAAAGADGFVIGCLTPEGDLDGRNLERLVRAAGGRGLTLHRAFDVCRDGRRTLREAAQLGLATVLTSGQAADAYTGRALLARMQQQAAGRIEILAGSGVHADNIPLLVRETGILSYHLSGKKTIPSRMIFRRPGVPMGLPGFEEFELWQTDPEAVRRARQALDSL